MYDKPSSGIGRRRTAIDRLRTLSTTAAVAGIAGTVGFGAVAAATWSGDPNATPFPTSPATGDTSGAGSSGGDTGIGGTTGQQPPAAAPNGAEPAPDGGFALPPTVPIPRSGRGGHAATGGSN